MSAALVSIILATYNGERYLRPQLDSLLAQEGAEIEIVACDDASSDDTPAILGEYRDRYADRIRVIVQPRNVGYVKNFETGILAARGEYVSLCDQDDVWLPAKTARLRKAVEAGAALSFCDLEVVDEGLRRLGHGMWRVIGFGRRERRMLASGNSFDVFGRRNVANGCALLLRRDLALKALPFPALEIFVHDQWLACFASFFGPVAALPERLVLYRQHPGQQTGAEGGNIPAIAGKAGEGRDWNRWREDWEILFERLAREGADPAAIGAARDSVAARADACRRRSGLRGLGDLLGFLLSGTYRRYFSGLKSFARDFLRLVSGSTAGRGL
jgi:glycosyltransferase involved in cell wall biosynthesis